MQEFFGSRLASNINLVAQLILLAGLLYGLFLARQKRFAQHANAQTAMVLLNLILIALVMAPSFYGYATYVAEGGPATAPIAQLMVTHGLLGLAVEIYAIYLVLRMRTSWIPARFRVGNIKVAMRVSLALWAVLVLLGIGIYADRFLVQRTVASAPLLELRQLGADLYVHAVELEDAVARDRLPAVKRHAEHLVNLIEGENGLHYGDNDIDGHLEDPGDGVGLLARVDSVATVADDPAVAAQAGVVRGQLDEIVALSLAVLGAQASEETTDAVAAIVELARGANAEGVFAIDQAARAAGIVEHPPASTPDPETGAVTIHEDQFAFLPSQITIPAGTTVEWVNDERAKHTATADDGLFESGDQSLGDRYSFTFSEPGVYPYFCRYHGDIGGVGMAGTIVVE